MNKLAGLALLGTLITLTGCEDANEVKEDAKKTSAQVQEKLGDAWTDVKDKTNELINDESFQNLLSESKEMGLDMYDDGKDVAVEAWIKSKEAAGELSEKTKQKAREIAQEIEDAREEHNEN
jgi:Skp family chaperone for outer membrane proteins